MAKVAFQNVSKRFDEDTLALNQFSLTIEDGEFVVLVGSSGCGKSTALRLLAGLDSVSEGEILIDDKLVNRTNPQQRNIAMVFQNYALYPHMTVADNLAFPLKMRHSPTQLIDDKVRQIAELLDLTDLLARRPKQLSGGQRQRVAMGRALVRDPSVFLLDEPLSNLDARLRAQIRADIAQLQTRLNKTTLYVTHDQVEAMTLGDRVAVMNQGEIQQLGTPEEIYAHPQNVFVAKFIGSPGMNIITSTLLNEDDVLAVRIGEQTISLPGTTEQAGQEIIQYLNRPILLGIRPEAFRSSPLNHCLGLACKILSVEYLGHESLVYFQLAQSDQNSEQLIARMPGQFHSENFSEQVLYIDPGDIYVFNNTGETMLGKTGPENLCP